MSVDFVCHTVRWPVRNYELDSNGHVNNAVYLNWAEQMAMEHAELAGYGRAWSRAQGGWWLVHRNLVTYHRPARFGDVVELTVRVIYLRGSRGVRQTEICRAADREVLAEVVTEWVWVRDSDGHPARVPREMEELARSATEATLARDPHFLQALRRTPGR